MKCLILCVAVLATFALTEGRWRGHKKEILDQIKDLNGPNSVPFHRGKKQHLSAHADLNEEDWLKLKDLKFSKNCKIECAKHEVCLVHVKDETEKCVKKHNIKEGRRLFRKYRQRKQLLKADIKGSKMDFKKDLMTAENMKKVYSLAEDVRIKPTHHDSRSKHKKNQSAHDSKRKHTGRGQHKGKKINGECSANEMYEIRKRLIGWFVMLHTESRQQHHQGAHKLDVKELGRHGMKEGKFHHKRNRRSVPNVETETHGHCKCTKSAMWEFHKMNKNEDHYLSHAETAIMEENHREPCMVPFLKTCDRDHDNQLSKMEWCCCLADVIAPCAEKTWNEKLAGGKVMPRCDLEGYYLREQCMDHHCWCVDLNGNEIAGTKVEGKTNCGKFDPTGHLMKM